MWLFNISCSLIIGRDEQRILRKSPSHIWLSHIIRNCTSKSSFREKLEIFYIPISYRNHPFDGWFLINDRIVFKLATIFLNLTNRKKTQQIETIHTGKWERKLFEGEKVFINKIIYIFQSVLAVCVLLKAVKAWRKFQGVGQWVCIKFTCTMKQPQLKKSD